MASTISSAFGGVRQAHFFQGYIINIPVGVYLITGHEIYFRLPPFICPVINPNIRVNPVSRSVYNAPSIPARIRTNLITPVVKPPCC